MQRKKRNSQFSIFNFNKKPPSVALRKGLQTNVNNLSKTTPFLVAKFVVKIVTL